MPGTHSAGTVQRRLKGHKKQPELVIHRQVARRPHSGSYTSADMRRPQLHKCYPPNTCARRCSAHVHVQRCTQTSITGVHTPLLSNAFMYAHTQFPTHTLTQQTTGVYTNTHHQPHHPTLIPWHPHEPAPALLSTRDWPTRIRILDARMDRQKLSKMMERSDLINLRGHSGQRQRSWLPCPTWDDWSPPAPPSQCPTYLQKAA